jgi:hypothetical protein
MTLEQLEIIGRLVRANKKSVSYLSAKFVLVDGVGQAEVSRTLGVKPNAVNNGVQRYKKIYEELSLVFNNDGCGGLANTTKPNEVLSSPGEKGSAMTEFDDAPYCFECGNDNIDKMACEGTTASGTHFTCGICHSLITHNIKSEQ